jgi:hypothetical protein
VVEEIKNGTRRTLNGSLCVYFDGYWIRCYIPPKDTLAERKRLIDNLTRRTFHHTEPGINTPGDRLELARAAHDRETEPKRKRIKAAMLAGALFNRATDIFTSVVDLAERGVTVSQDNELMRECGACFQEALALGKQVKHYSGHEGIDELWGEPFKAFTLPVEKFYESRYIKIAQSMRDIDRVADRLVDLFDNDPSFSGLTALIRTYAGAAKSECETMKSDTDIFDIWANFTASGEAVVEFEPRMADSMSKRRIRRIVEGRRLVREGKELMAYVAGARVPMPKSTQAFLDRCEAYQQAAVRISDDPAKSSLAAR